MLGFCYGGLTGWLSATRGEKVKMRPDCCVGYYAGGIGKVAAEEPVCPVLLHFGAADDHIGSDQVEAVRTSHPEVEIYLYEGVGHAFANPDRPELQAAAAKLACAAVAGVFEDEPGLISSILFEACRIAGFRLRVLSLAKTLRTSELEIRSNNCCVGIGKEDRHY